jgi:DNA-binding response OmpR family regulator
LSTSCWYARQRGVNAGRYDAAHAHQFIDDDTKIATAVISGLTAEGFGRIARTERWPVMASEGRFDAVVLTRCCPGAWLEVSGYASGTAPILMLTARIDLDRQEADTGADDYLTAVLLR